MSDFLHTLDRFVIHFFSSCGVLVCVLFAVGFLKRKTKWMFLPDTKVQMLLISALLVFAFSTLREAVDVSQGQPLYKAFTDYLSWLTGAGTSAWGLYRFQKQ